jgi:hypothetical protein
MGNIPPPLLIFIVIVVLSAIIGGLAQVLRNQQQTEQTRAATARAASRDAANQSGRAGGNDIDRFLEEIDKLRKKPASEATGPAAPPPVARKVAKPVADVPTVEPRRPRTAEPPRSATRVEDLPVAPVVTPASKASLPFARPVVTPARDPAVQTEFGKQLMGLLGKRQAVPLAVALHEILGPPKCRQQRP